MKNAIITTPNIKGQIVIPKKFREALAIGSGDVLKIILRGKGIYIYPVDEVISKIDRESSYEKLLEKTQGTWEEEKSEQTSKKRRIIELRASKIRRKQW